jgi:hypothetical protein
MYLQSRQSSAQLPESLKQGKVATVTTALPGTKGESEMKTPSIEE